MDHLRRRALRAADEKAAAMDALRAAATAAGERRWREWRDRVLKEASDLCMKEFGVRAAFTVRTVKTVSSDELVDTTEIVTEIEGVTVHYYEATTSFGEPVAARLSHDLLKLGEEIRSKEARTCDWCGTVAPKAYNRTDAESLELHKATKCSNKHPGLPRYGNRICVKCPGRDSGWCQWPTCPRWWLVPS